MENIPFPPVSLLHSSFPFLPPRCFMYMNRWRTSAGEFPKVQWEVLLVALHARLLWLKPMMWGCYLYLRRGEDRSDGFLPVKQGEISDMTHRKKSVFYIQVIPDNEMQKKPLKLFFTSLKWSSLQSSHTHWMPVRENVTIIRIAMVCEIRSKVQNSFQVHRFTVKP